jgi:hypothetical protein
MPNHLSSIYAKLGVHSQVDPIRPIRRGRRTPDAGGLDHATGLIPPGPDAFPATQYPADYPPYGTITTAIRDRWPG